MKPVECDRVRIGNAQDEEASACTIKGIPSRRDCHVTACTREPPPYRPPPPPHPPPDEVHSRDVDQICSFAFAHRRCDVIGIDTNGNSRKEIARRWCNMFSLRWNVPAGLRTKGMHHRDTLDRESVMYAREGQKTPSIRECVLPHIKKSRRRSERNHYASLASWKKTLLRLLRMIAVFLSIFDSRFWSLRSWRYQRCSKCIAKARAIHPKRSAIMGVPRYLFIFVCLALSVLFLDHCALQFQQNWGNRDTWMLKNSLECRADIRRQASSQTRSESDSRRSIAIGLKSEDQVPPASMVTLRLRERKSSKPIAAPCFESTHLLSLPVAVGATISTIPCYEGYIEGVQLDGVPGLPIRTKIRAQFGSVRPGNETVRDKSVTITDLKFEEDNGDDRRGTQMCLVFTQKGSLGYVVVK